MFKSNWEKTSVTHQLPQGVIEQMLQLAYPDKELISSELIAGGCANLNIKILLEGEPYPLILRIYLRNKDAVYREQKLGTLLKQTVPVPLTYYIGEVKGYHFGVTEFMPGISLRDLLLSDMPHDINAILYDVGEILSKITIHEFPRAGFFDQNLSVIPHKSSDDCLIYAKDCLKHKTVLSVFTPGMIVKTSAILAKYGHLFPSETEKHLVHADFDPANILVNKVDGAWKVSGILDWEFAFSGSVLWDVANMLRYAHKMPPEFQDAFLNGLTQGGVKLPEDWHIITHLLNLSALLDCLKRSDPNDQPNQCSDICKLINHILGALTSKNVPKKYGYENNYDSKYRLPISSNISIRKLSAFDIPIIVDAFQKANWPKPALSFETYLQEQLTDSRLVWIAQVDNQFAGYVTLKWQSYYKPFAAAHIPEIMDLNVLPSFRKAGVGSRLLDSAEKEAALKSDIVGLGVGLYGGPDGGYGAAQKLYISRGYRPDGKGVSYDYKNTIPGNSYPLDDNLILWFTKRLR